MLVGVDGEGGAVVEGRKESRRTQHEVITKIKSRIIDISCGR